MKKRVCQLIFDSLGDQYHGKAMECLKALRDAAVKVRIAFLAKGTKGDFLLVSRTGKV